MTTFIVRIFFSGLIAFVPSTDNKELTVLLLDARDGFYASDGTAIEPHHPILVARAGACSGACGPGDPSIATHLFPAAGSETAATSLTAALGQGGAAWQLAGSDLELRYPKPEAAESASLELRRAARRAAEALPVTSTEREDFSWVPDMAGIDQEAGVVDPDVLAYEPKKGLIAARLKISSGKVVTYRLVGVDNRVIPLRFRKLRSKGEPLAYAQALANWVEARIEIAGNSLDLVERPFGKETARRTVTLSPQPPVSGEGPRLIEIAVLNIPDKHAPSLHEELGHPGKHFELYYEAAKVRPPLRLRLVPYAGDERTEGAAVDWSLVHPKLDLWSDLIEALGLGDGRGIYDKVICPLLQFSPGGG